MAFSRPVPGPLFPTGDPYPTTLKQRAGLKMAAMMLLLAVVFWTAPNPVAFSILARGGVSISPPALAALFTLCAVGYLLLPHPLVLRRPQRFQRLYFWLLSAPFALYMAALGVILLLNGRVLLGMSYATLYGVIFLLGFTIYNGYSRLLEYSVLATLITLFLLTGAALTTSGAALTTSVSAPPTSGGAFLQVLHLAPGVIVVLCIFAVIVYASFLHPAVAALSTRPRRVGVGRLTLRVVPKHLLFVAGEFVLPLLASLLLLFALNTHTSLVPSLALFDLSLLIHLLGQSLYRPSVEV